MIESTPVLQTDKLSFRYGDLKALEHVDLQVTAGQFSALLGRNGAGKSTLFSLVTGLYRAHEGAIRIDGHDLVKQTSQALSSIGVVFQQSTLDQDLTVEQNLYYAAALQGLGRRSVQAYLGQLQRELALVELRKKKTGSLSGGQRRRVELARALLHRPKLLLLDEPTVGLDLESRRDFVALVRKLCLSEGVGVLWATHLMDEIESGDKLNILHQGLMIASGQVSSLIDQHACDDVVSLFEKLVSSGSSS